MSNKVVVYHGTVTDYFKENPWFRPSEQYPEYVFKSELSSEKNLVYEQVRNTFILGGYDENHIGTNEWNPLGDYIKPGDCVVVKPNLVMHTNPKGIMECLFTQPSVTAAILDYIIIAQKGKGKIVVGDAPMQECDFDKLVNSSGYSSLIEFYRRHNIDISLVDFRELKSTVVQGVHHASINERHQGKIVDLGVESEFESYTDSQLKRLRITNYDPRILNSHHTKGKHEYCVSQYILNADVIVNMPKPKSHRKAGVTISLKNMIGTCVRKEFLPHHCLGDTAIGGDEYDKNNIVKALSSRLLDQSNVFASEKKYELAKIFKKLFGKTIRFALRLEQGKQVEGSWYGNNTISKTIADINKIIWYADKNGVMRKEQQRKMFIVADMIWGGGGKAKDH